MATLAVEIPDLVARRIEALATAQDKSVEQLAIECLDSLAGDFRSRRAILKARRSTAAPEGSASLDDLGWLDGYAGQSVDELLAYEGKEHVGRLVRAVEEAIHEKMKAQGMGKKTGVERVVLSVSAFQQEVNNGGFDQYFRNSSRMLAPVIVEDLERIGCKRIANIARRALNSLGLPKLAAPEIEAAIKVPNVKRDRELFRCNNSFYKTTELSKRLFAYIKANRNGIQI
jgi:hypothetical protein